MTDSQVAEVFRRATEVPARRLHVPLLPEGLPFLSSNARLAITRPEHEVYLSALSAWEISRKWAKGDLKLPGHPSSVNPTARKAAGVAELPVTEEDALVAEKLPPIDRLLMAQALNRNLVILTPGPMFEPYPVRVMWYEIAMATTRTDLPSKARLDELVEEALVDAYGESEEVTGFYTMMENDLRTPFETKVLGATVLVDEIDITDDDQLVAVCRKEKVTQRISLTELPLPSPLPEGGEWIVAYRYWRTGKIR